MSDIAVAGVEQATGLGQINKALAQMDEVAQKNSALVEENAATAKMLDQQARAMDERVSLFRFDDGRSSGEVAPRTAAKAKRMAAAASAA